MVPALCPKTFWFGCRSNLGGKCPVDAVDLSHENIFPDNFTRREIMQSKAKCPFASDGCEAVLLINEMERHVHTDHVGKLSTSSSSPGKLNGVYCPTGGVDVVDCWFKEFGCDIRVHPSEMHRHMDADVYKHLHVSETMAAMCNCGNQPKYSFSLQSNS